jgi:hypothetical protein
MEVIKMNNVLMLTNNQRNIKLSLSNGLPVACEDCCHCDDYFKAGFGDEDVIWKKCNECVQADYQFTLEFWNEKIAWMLNGDKTENKQICVRINGSHYVINEEDSSIKGFGGARFKIHFTSGAHAGKTITTTNMWHQGDIPSEFAIVLTDNAEFIKNY